MAFALLISRAGYETVTIQLDTVRTPALRQGRMNAPGLHTMKRHIFVTIIAARARISKYMDWERVDEEMPVAD